MKTRTVSISLQLILLLFMTTVLSGDFFSGTWCIGDEKLVITFTGEDSLSVSSSRDESIGGEGTYEKKDSLFIATLINDELELKMGYRYKKKNNSSIRAKIAFLIVDGDSVNHPRRWMRMERCNPDTMTVEDTESENGEE